MSDRIQQLTVFTRAADGGSFSRAARELGLSQPSVSRIVSELEARLGVKLILRTTRRLTLTEAGAAFLARARRVLSELEDAEDVARGIDSLRGTIRVAMSVLFGTRAVIPYLPEFLARHPDLRVKLMLADERQDLVVEGADVAIRFGPLDDSAFGARKIATTERWVTAAPAYLQAHGVPRTPADLAEHECMIGPGRFGRARWTFTRAGKTESVSVRGRVATDSAAGMLACLMAGMGIAIASDVMSGPEIEAGALVRLLPRWTTEGADVYAVFPAGPRPSAKVRALVDHIARNLEVRPWARRRLG
ncbi:MAG TPA: LysR substrate-binding domain-containing protein [Thermoanaerobaculia bacterium]|nr:LysR substrate-binding domain-containing protein [Thermoanaerobaculia bacterium]